MQNHSSETTHKPTSTKSLSRPNGTAQSVVRTSYSLRDYLRIVLARKWIVLFIFLASIAATFYYLETVTPVYRTEVVIMREDGEQLPASIMEITPFAPKESLRSHMMLLKSSSSVAKIKERLKNNYSPPLEGQGWVEVTVPQIIDGFSLAYDENDTSIIRLTATASVPKQAQALANVVAELYTEKVAEMKIAHLDKGVNFLKTHTELLDEKLQKAEEVLNKFKEEEGVWMLSPTTSDSSTLSGGLLAKLGNMYADLSQTETDIEWASAQLQSVRTLISEKRKSSLSSLTTSLPSQIDQIQSKLVDLHLELDTLKEQFTEKDLQVTTVQRQIDALQKRLESEFEKLLKNEGTTSLDPLAELQELLQQSVSLNVQLNGLEQKAAVLKQKIDTFKDEHPELIAKQVELTRLERQARVFEYSYTRLLDRSEEMLLLREMKAGGLTILDSATLPEFPISPQKKRTLIFGFMIGLVLGIGLAFFLEYIDDSIKLKEDVERHLRLPVMGTIPKIAPFEVSESALSRRELPEAHSSKLQHGENNPSNSTPNEVANGSEANRRIGNSPQPPVTSYQLPEPNDTDEQSSRRGVRSRYEKGHRKRIKRLLSNIILYADSKNPIFVRYRTLAANIKYANVDTPIQSLLVTSAAPMEGKTSTSTNLAISMAQTGSKVILVDADLRRPRIHRIFQQDRSLGLTDFLVDENNVIEEIDPQADSTTEELFIRPTDIDNLYLFPCGSHVSAPEGLLSSEKMKKLIKVLSEQCDIIIFDSPPLVSSADAMILSTQVDATLMVICSGKTKRQIALQGKELLENVDAKIVGAVLNNIDYSKQYGAYYYYYYYYRSYYYSNEEDED